MHGPVEDVYDLIREEVGDGLQACGYFSEEDSEVLYCDEATRERYSAEEIEAVLETALLDTIADPMYEGLHNEELRATIRVFESKVDILVGFLDHEGLIFAVDTDPECTYQQLATEITEAVDG